MCGFLGFWPNFKINKNQFQNNLSRINYRGPDYSNVKQIDDVILGHNRLSIIDLKAQSNQPLVSSCGRYNIVFNGEIYNYIELKNEINDYKFITNSDTEVILASFAKWGEKCLSKLNGMFSFAIYDKKEKSIFLARDRMGKKPLYYSISKDSLCFGSEVKALVNLPGVELNIDQCAFNDYFSKGFIGYNRSIFDSIKQLPPGSFLKLRLDKLKVINPQYYWSLPVTSEYEKCSEIELIDEFDQLLNESINIRMKSDVPLGVFLSGGLDSSLIVAIAAKISKKPISTYTIGFTDQSMDETNYAKLISNYYKTNHNTFTINNDITSILPKIFSSLDQPFADSSLLPMYLVSREAQKYVTVALSGDGGDELFAGYGHYNDFAFEQQIRKILPRTITKSIGLIANCLPERHKTRTLKRFKFDDIYQSMGQYAARFFNYQERLKLFSNRNNVLNFPEVEFIKQFNPDLDWLQNICQADMKGYMVDDILVKVDRMSMMNSLEVRSPLLDYKIAEFSFLKVPSTLKRNGPISKYILKELGKRYLPKNFVFNRKHGFGVPLSDWFKSSLGDRLKDIFENSHSGYLNKSEVLNYIKMHNRGYSNYSKKLFSILVWEEWFSNFKTLKNQK